jgi:phage tail sheath protein FI
LRTIAFNDQVAYPWFAPAGLQRGLVTNAQTVGYLTDEGEFQEVQLNQGQRDVLYLNNINPIAARPNRGLAIWGQKTLSPVTSALDRINVARLINYIRFNLDEAMQPFLFEPNDAETRESVTVTVERFLGDLLGKRALFDYGVRCDETNNTPTRIDRNELWVDIALKPTKAIEFIYIPIRILNTGDPIDSGSGQSA